MYLHEIVFFVTAAVFNEWGDNPDEFPTEYDF